MLKESRPAAAYLRSITAETWATHAFPLPRYGHITSNIVESQWNLEASSAPTITSFAW